MSGITSGSGTLLGGTSGGGLTEASTSSGRPTLSGLASGLDTAQIIQDLVSSQQSQITLLQNKNTTIQNEQSAWQQIQSDLSALQNDASTLSQTSQGVFNVNTVNTSNSSIATAVASSTATPGVYTLSVNSLAAANEIASQGYNSASSQITQGSFEISSGTNTPATITIDSTNDTLQGLANAVNNANVGVTASIVNDGSGNQGYRLVLTANQTGTANAIQITNNLAADNGGGALPVFNANYIGSAKTAAGYTGTSLPTANTGSGNYTGSTNDTYTFTVVNGGTVGTDNGITLSYTNATGTSTGTLTLNSADANQFQNVANGLQVEFAAGTLVAGQSFSVKTYVPTVQQAANASVTVGSGSGALTIQNSSNQIDNLIPGVTVDLQSASPQTPVTLTVTADTSAASNAIQNFVNDYNTLNSYISQATSFDSTTGTAGTLLGDPQIEQLQSQISSIVDSAVPGLTSNANTLSAIGITFDQNGQLVLDQTTLDNALSGGVSGVTLSDIQQLFGLNGTSNNSGIQFIAGSDQTQASGSVPYEVSITQAAQQASITATNAVSAPVTINSSNDTFSINVNGASSGTITLAAGTYTASGLAEAVQNAINSQAALSGDPVSVGLNDSNQLTVTTSSYGSSSTVAIGSGTALATLGFAGTESGTGTDVKGSFIVDGKTEAATGTGQDLVGSSSNANTSGLQVLVSLTPQEVGSGTTANLTITRGLASSLNVLLDGALNTENGMLSNINTGFETQENSITSQINAITTSIQNQEQALLTEFSNMEQAVSQLQTIGNFINESFNGSSSSSNSSSSKL